MAAAGSATAAVKGKVQGSGDLSNVYVYLEGMRSSGKGKALEIAQKDKQFSPRVAAVVAGTKVSFPNYDAMFHNVFSPSPKAFDLGTARAGEPGKAIELDTPGVVEVYCNIHARMNAKILVVPNRVFVKARPDGTFRLDKVPVGRRKIVAWGPSFKVERREVDVTPAGADVSFTMEPAPQKAHTNKSGLPYGSYKE
jgi:plastocyanin